PFETKKSSQKNTPAVVYPFMNSLFTLIVSVFLSYLFRRRFQHTAHRLLTMRRFLSTIYTIPIFLFSVNCIFLPYAVIPSDITAATLRFLLFLRFDLFRQII
ncbi:MAG: hypothetical protein MR543_03545, partial [Robinsoniella sp.]|nr:hypothetical protein [Robinsoniella sp.]